MSTTTITTTALYSSSSSSKSTLAIPVFDDLWSPKSVSSSLFPLNYNKIFIVAALDTSHDCSAHSLTTSLYTSTGELAYTSTRQHHLCGSSILSSPSTSFASNDLISTVCHLDHGRGRYLRYINPSENDPRAFAGREVQLFGHRHGLRGLSPSSKERFETPQGRPLEWFVEAAVREGGGRKRRDMLVLRDVETKVEIARFARTEGKKGKSGGNGALGICDEAKKGGKEVDEPLIVATCLFMLKKGVV